MKKQINILVIILVAILFVGCQSYKRDTAPGKIIEISLDDAIEKSKTEDEIILLFTQSTCKDCINLKKIVNPYLENHNIKINEVILDNEGTSDEEIQNNREKINSIFPKFNSTPSMYYLEDGKIIDEIFEVTNEKELDEWVMRNKLDLK
ncbi:hypothetical protein [Clostridium chauvoei]|uniref:Thioredoxin family protein n=2 Tax=Clostridium chauvoei TaxID=46867 RepID=S6EMK4_9CLOT|nr:hypothetical protein [Clostridium chauvoei]ATD55714.1 thioredoxin family protein [Clostridium chauvoei]ATD56609.1 thioredoxin family protein [Clostridium chauvoei]MBX7280258.1 thioredoxin family protein [Clostridium chauvoei]MBX7282743.1 thioredoxin family protein [Clostridium chauvoei]MBX7285149.1 thioredoxin family protein [Clostridium chauvoei]